MMKFRNLKKLEKSETIKRSTRRSDGVRAPCLSSTTRSNQRKGRRRKRGGKGRKRRAGARRSQKKSERIGKSHLRILYWNCRSLEQRGEYSRIPLIKPPLPHTLFLYLSIYINKDCIPSKNYVLSFQCELNYKGCLVREKKQLLTHSTSITKTSRRNIFYLTYIWK